MKYSGFTLIVSIALMLSFGVVGCNKPVDKTDAETPAPGPAVEAPPEPAPSGQTEGTSEPAAAQPASEEVTLQILDWDQTRALVNQHKGKVVVMDLWATFCPPCVAEFPHLVELHKELGQQVACISVSLDYEGFEDSPVESYKEKIMSFLKGKHATMTNILLSTDSETLFSRIEHKSMPVVYVFDQEGNLAGQFPDPKDPKEFTYADNVRPLVDQLLAKPAGAAANRPSRKASELTGD